MQDRIGLEVGFVKRELLGIPGHRDTIFLKKNCKHNSGTREHQAGRFLLVAEFFGMPEYLTLTEDV